MSVSSPKKLKIFISSGESSGDIIGANLIKAIKQQYPSCIIQGIGGQHMQQQGVQSIFPIQDISVMGYIEVLHKVSKIFRRLKHAICYITNFKPDIVITIDSHGFNFRLVKKIKPSLPKTKFVNYVSPSIWAYRYKRIYTIKKLFDHQLVLFPFEKQYYDWENIPCTFVGHPLTTLQYPHHHAVPFHKATTLCISVLPGSREGEVKTLLPIFLKSLIQLHKHTAKQIAIFIPTLQHLEQLIQEICAQYCHNTIHYMISSDPQDKHTYLPLSHVAITKSGTISLELMFYNIPIVVAHKINRITAFFIEKAVQVKYVSIGNIIASQEIIPELLQSKCNPTNIANITMQLLQNSNRLDYSNILRQLHNNNDADPGELAATTILNLLKS